MATGLGGPPWGDYPPLLQDQGGSYHPGPTMPRFMDRDGFYGELRFLRIQGVDGKPLPVAPFMIRKSIHKWAGGRIEGAFPESGGKTYALKVRQLSFFQKLLEMKNLSDGTPVEVVEHPGFNQTRCVVTCRDVVDEDVNVIMEEMQDQGVKDVRRIRRRVGGKQVNTPTLIVTTRGTVRPDFLDFGFIRCRTRPYYPSPMQCFACWAFGHTRQRCTSTPVCGRCAQSHAMEPENQCLAEKHCTKCESNEHGIGERSCPEYIKEGDIQRIRVDSNLSYAAARRKYEESHGTESYANIAAGSAATDVNISQDLASLHRKIDSLLAAIEKKDQRIEQLEAALSQSSTTTPSSSLVSNVFSHTDDDMPAYMKTFLDRQEQMFGNTIKKMWESNLRMQRDIIELQTRSTTSRETEAGLPLPETNIASLSSPSSSATISTDPNIIDTSLTVFPLDSTTTTPVSPDTKTVAVIDSPPGAMSDTSSDSSISPNKTSARTLDTPRPSPKTHTQNGTTPKVPVRPMSPGSTNKRPLQELSPDKGKSAQNASKQQRRLPLRGGQPKKS